MDKKDLQEGTEHHAPYRIVKKAVFSNIKREELVDGPHAARLQYRLMLLDSIIKAAVDFADSRITVIYNPRGSDNTKEKIGLDEIVGMLAREGVHADPNSISDSDYDYLKGLYFYAYNPITIRESPPYTYTVEEWRGMKPAWERKMGRIAVKRRERFKRWQEKYLETTPRSASKTE